MSRHYRRRDEGFSKKVDISHLYRIGKATVQLRKIGEQMQSEQMLREVEEIECALAVIDQKVVDFNLKQYEMPPDQPEGYRGAAAPAKNRL
jgi:hypothetical protein